MHKNIFPLPMRRPIWLMLTLIFLATVPWASAQSTLTWIGSAANTANASGTANWLDATAPAGGSDYNFVFNPSDLVSPSRTAMSWNVANVGLLSLSLTGSGGTNFTWGGSSSIALKGGITVNSGDHTFNTTATVANDATWDIAAGSSLTRSAANSFTLGADRKITKTGAGTLLLTGANSGIAGVLEVQQGMLRVGANAALGSGTVALNGGTLLIAANTTLTNTSASVSVLGDSTLIVNRGANLGSITHLMGDLSAGAGKLRVESGSLITGTNTGEVVFGVTTLTNNATFETVNNGTGGTTRLTLGAVGETGGARGLTKTGFGELRLSASNTYSGDTTVSDGTVRLTRNGVLRFVIGGSGTNNAMLGAGTAVLEGQFSFDLTSASTNTNAAWTIVANTLTNSYGTNFLVTGFNGAGGLWTNTANGVSYVFAQSTGVLSVQGGAPVNNYDSWVSYWTNADPGFTDTAGAADHDGDSFSNNLEFAFDGHTAVGTPALLTATTVGTNAVFNYVVRKNPPGGVGYQVKATTNLATGPWTNSEVSISNSSDQSGINIPADYERKEFTAPVAAREFYRVQATIVP